MLIPTSARLNAPYPFGPSLHPQSLQQPSVCSLYLWISSVLSPSLFLYYFCFPSLMFICYVSLFFFNVYLFWERQRQNVSGLGQREGGTESEAGSRLRAVSTEPDTGLKLTRCENKTWAEVGCSTDWATQVPHLFCLLKSSILFLSLWSLIY